MIIQKLNHFTYLKYRQISQNFKKNSYIAKSLNGEQNAILEKLEIEGSFKDNIFESKYSNIDLSWLDHRNDLIESLDKRQANDYLKIKDRSKGSYVVELDKIDNVIMNKFKSFATSSYFTEIFANYFNLEVLFRGVQVRKDLNDGKNIETRMWHCDGEDSRIIKIIFYLNEVDKNDGPFAIFQKKELDKSSKIPMDNHGRVLDETINNMGLEKSVNEFYGKFGDFIITDTCSIYHKGQLPINSSRYAIFLL